MRPVPVFSLPLVIASCMIAVQPASASFYLMQIEQVIGGVNGDTSAQAIQLRTRFPGEHELEFARLRAWDATGTDPITLIDFDTRMPPSDAGARVLVTSPNFAGYTDAPLAADFMMTTLIPDAYLAAGRITYEGDDGTIYWSLSFGGTGYTGPTTGAMFNDADGEFGPSFVVPLPSSDLSGLLFQGTAVDLSTSNLTDYALTVGPAVFTNNAGVSASVVPEPATFSLLVFGTWLLTRRRPSRQG